MRTIKQLADFNNPFITLGVVPSQTIWLLHAVTANWLAEGDPGPVAAFIEVFDGDVDVYRFSGINLLTHDTGDTICFARAGAGPFAIAKEINEALPYQLYLQPSWQIYLGIMPPSSIVTFNDPTMVIEEWGIVQVKDSGGDGGGDGGDGGPWWKEQ